MSLSLDIQEILQSWWVSVSTSKKILTLDETRSRHPTYFPVSMSLSLNNHRLSIIKVLLSHWRGVPKKWIFFNLVLEPKLLNMISYKQKDKIKSKRWAMYLKNWPSYGFHKSSQGKISISPSFQISKSHQVSEISTQIFCMCAHFW